jgi:hypothetical protein
MDKRKFECRNGFDCATCGYLYMGGVECSICSIELCDYCCEEGNILNFTQSVTNCSNKCSKCERIGCLKCITMCYICVSEKKESIILCQDDTIFTKNSCFYHEASNFHEASNLSTCELHKQLRCNQCIEDKNYDSYGHWFDN